MEIETKELIEIICGILIFIFLILIAYYLDFQEFEYNQIKSIILALLMVLDVWWIVFQDMWSDVVSRWRN